MPYAPSYQMDANVLIRFLRNDHKDFSPRAAKFIQRARDGKIVLHVAAITVAEIFYALKVSYKVHRREAAQTLAAVLNTPAFTMRESSRIFDAPSAFNSPTLTSVTRTSLPPPSKTDVKSRPSTPISTNSLT